MNAFYFISGICSILSLIISIFISKYVYKINTKVKNIECSFNKIDQSTDSKKQYGIIGNKLNGSSISGVNVISKGS
jgi:hypothetical protein